MSKRQRDFANPANPLEIEVQNDQPSGDSFVMVRVPAWGTIVGYEAYILDNTGATSLVTRIRRRESSSDVDGSVLLQTQADATNPTLVNVEPWRTYRRESDDGGCTGWLWLYGTPNQAHAVRHVLRVLPHWERRP